MKEVIKNPDHDPNRVDFRARLLISAAGTLLRFFVTDFGQMVTFWKLRMPDLMPQ
jgi:hypothetical protein